MKIKPLQAAWVARLGRPVEVGVLLPRMWVLSWRSFAQNEIAKYWTLAANVSAVAASVVGNWSKWDTGFCLEEQSSGKFGPSATSRHCLSQGRKALGPSSEGLWGEIIWSCSSHWWDSHTVVWIVGFVFTGKGEEAVKKWWSLMPWPESSKVWAQLVLVSFDKLLGHQGVTYTCCTVWCMPKDGQISGKSKDSTGIQLRKHFRSGWKICWLLQCWSW